jgi:hypothetical membrane protein
MAGSNRLLVPLTIGGFAIFNILFILAVLNSQDFTLFTSWVSDLGVGPSAQYFNPACMIAGAALLPIFALLLKSSSSIKFSQIACALGFLSGIALIGVGAFPETHELHSSVSIAFFILAALAVLSYTLSYGHALGFINHLAFFGALHFILTILLATAVIENTKSAPRYETLAVFSFQLWMLSAAFSKKEKEKGEATLP